jgi:hypothetical protein
MIDIIKPGTLKGLWRFIEWKHFHKKHPENWNILSVPSTTKMKIFNGKTWVEIEAREAVEQMYQRICDDIDNFIGYAKEKEIPVELKKFQQKIAEPMQFDMLHLEFDTDNYTLAMEDAKENMYEQTIQHLKILSQNINGESLQVPVKSL